MARTQSSPRRRALCTAAVASAAACLLSHSVLPSQQPGSLGGEGLGFAGHVRPKAIARRSAVARRSKTGPWSELQKGPEVMPSDADAKVMPIFPVRTIEWPGSVVQLKVIEPAHRRLYEDFLMKGSRYLMAPLAILPHTGRAPTEDTPVDQRQVCTVGALLKLTDLKEVSEQTDGVVKYKARHTVVGRARLRGILNPSAAFEVDDYGAKIDYLRGEVEIMHDDELHEGGMDPNAPEEMAKAMEELRCLSATLSEPRLESEEVIQNAMTNTTSWQIASLWTKLQQSKKRHRDGIHLISQVEDWVKMQQELGKLPQELPDELDPRAIGMPEDLLNQVKNMQQRIPPPLESGFFEPLLQVLGEDSARVRGELLTEMIENEVRATRARASLRSLLG